MQQQRAFSSNDVADVNHHQPMYGTDDDFTRDVADLLHLWFQNPRVTRERWIEVVHMMDDFWNTRLHNPWTNRERMERFMYSMESQDDGDQDIITKEEFCERWNIALEVSEA